MSIKILGFSLIELLVAITIAGVVITTAVITMSGIHLSQKKISVSQDFYSESRFLMEKIVREVRNNTLDYDAYCENPLGSFTCATPYVSNFYKAVGGKTRNMGGMTADGQSVSTDTKAWDEGTAQTVLYLINRDRTIRTALRRTLDAQASDNYQKLEMLRQLGADKDGDGDADIWNGSAQMNDVNSVPTCQIQEGGTWYTILGDATNEDFCSQSHDWTIISPDQIQVTDLTFEPSPNRDPFLSFRVESAQVHPHVFIALHTTLRDSENFGIPASETPNVLLQTTASSRVYGNTRK